jgi:hypothetical protein
VQDFRAAIDEGLVVHFISSCEVREAV